MRATIYAFKVYLDAKESGNNDSTENNNENENKQQNQ